MRPPSPRAAARSPGDGALLGVCGVSDDRAPPRRRAAPWNTFSSANAIGGVAGADGRGDATRRPAAGVPTVCGASPSADARASPGVASGLAAAPAPILGPRNRGRTCSLNASTSTALRAPLGTATWCSCKTCRSSDTRSLDASVAASKRTPPGMVADGKATHGMEVDIVDYGVTPSSRWPVPALCCAVSAASANTSLGTGAYAAPAGCVHGT